MKKFGNLHSSSDVRREVSPPPDMSYGFTLVPTDSEQYLAAFARDDSEHDEELPASPAQRERMHAVGAALKNTFPALPRTWFDEDLIEFTSPQGRNLARAGKLAPLWSSPQLCLLLGISEIDGNRRHGMVKSKEKSAVW